MEGGSTQGNQGELPKGDNGTRVKPFIRNPGSMMSNKMPVGSSTKNTSLGSRFRVLDQENVEFTEQHTTDSTEVLREKLLTVEEPPQRFAFSSGRSSKLSQRKKGSCSNNAKKGECSRPVTHELPSSGEMCNQMSMQIAPNEVLPGIDRPGYSGAILPSSSSSSSCQQLSSNLSTKELGSSRAQSCSEEIVREEGVWCEQTEIGGSGQQPGRRESARPAPHSLLP